jgi:hypothetical protein
MKRPQIKLPDWIKPGQASFTHAQCNELLQLAGNHIIELNKYIDIKELKP